MKTRSYDSSKLNDPVADQTSWFPIGIGTGGNRRILLAQDRLAFVPATRDYFFPALVFGVGLFVIFLFIVAKKDGDDLNFLLTPLVGLIFLALGIFMFRKFTAPIVFDKTGKAFRKGCGKKEIVIDLERIYAIQLLEDDDGESTSYELNLVLDNGLRTNVLYHNDHAKIQDDAKTLADFLNTKLWNTL